MTFGIHVYHSWDLLGTVFRAALNQTHKTKTEQKKRTSHLKVSLCLEANW